MSTRENRPARQGHVFIIAEAGVNHNGSLEMAMELAEAARDAGADAVKYQTFRAEDVISASAAKAEYQKQTTGAGESQLDMVKKLELSFEEHARLAEHCARIGIRYLSTPFDMASADFLIHDIRLELIKIPSGEITNAPLLRHIAASGVEIILSTGMSTLGEVEEALGALACGYLGTPPSRAAFAAAWANEAGRAALRGKVTLLHCTTQYPAPFADVHLPVMGLMREAFGLPVGYSDHTPGIAMPIAAAALGACVIEKHFTLDRNLPGPDHRASLEPQELAAMVAGVRAVEQAMTPGVKAPAPSEIGNRAIARKSLTAARDIAAGEPFTPENLTAKRPGDGLSPMLYWELLGRKSRRSHAAGEQIEAPRAPFNNPEGEE